MATAMAAVLGRSSSQISCAACEVKPSCMRSSVELDSCSMASDCRARTESGSISRRMANVRESVKARPATIIVTTLTSGDTAVPMRTMADRAAMAKARISMLKKRGCLRRPSCTAYGIDSLLHAAPYT